MPSHNIAYHDIVVTYLLFHSDTVVMISINMQASQSVQLGCTYSRNKCILIKLMMKMHLWCVMCQNMKVKICFHVPFRG